MFWTIFFGVITFIINGIDWNRFPVNTTNSYLIGERLKKLFDWIDDGKIKLLSKIIIFSRIKIFHWHAQKNGSSSKTFEWEKCYCYRWTK